MQTRTVRIAWFDILIMIVMLVIADADMHVAPDWLHRLVVALDEPGVGRPVIVGL